MTDARQSSWGIAITADLHSCQEIADLLASRRPLSKRLVKLGAVNEDAARCRHTTADPDRGGRELTNDQAGAKILSEAVRSGTGTTLLKGHRGPQNEVYLRLLQNVCVRAISLGPVALIALTANF
jgi:hypothetical protein